MDQAANTSTETFTAQTQTEKIFLEKLQAMHQTVESLQTELKISNGAVNEPIAHQLQQQFLSTHIEK